MRSANQKSHSNRIYKPFIKSVYAKSLHTVYCTQILNQKYLTQILFYAKLKAILATGFLNLLISSSEVCFKMCV